MNNNTKTDVYIIPSHSADWKITGEGRKGLCVIVSSGEFGDAERETLSRMMGAIHYNLLEDVWLVELKLPSSFSVSGRGIEWTDLLLFGVKPADMGFQIEAISDSILFLEKRRVLIIPSLGEINQQVQKKQVLWKLLQEMFLNKTNVQR